MVFKVIDYMDSLMASGFEEKQVKVVANDMENVMQFNLSIYIYKVKTNNICITCPIII